MLVSLHSILEGARHGHYGIGAFNCLSLEMAVGAVRAAEKARSPIILQLAEVQFPGAPMELMAPVFLELAYKAAVPVCVHLDHGQSLETCVKAIKLGFNSVMFDGAYLPFEENVKQTMQIARVAKAAGIDIEAELGRVGDAGICNETLSCADIFTDADQAAEFVRLTGIDALAIAIGNLHGKYIATPKLNISRLQEIFAKTGIPLVLHGGSGTSDEDFKACVHNGICKVNVATSLQLAVARDIRCYVTERGDDAGYCRMKDIIADATENTVLQHMELFECIGKA